MDNTVEEIKKRIDIVDYIGNFAALKKSGRNFKALCPFHQEKTPSFIISSDRQIWHCFGACQTGGDIVSFLMKWENITFYEALKELAQKAGIQLKKLDFEDQAWKKKERLLAVNQLAAEFYHYILKNHQIAEKAREYLKARKITTKSIETFNLGYSPNSWISLLKFLKKKGFADQEIFETGLLVKNRTGGFYDRFRKRIVFPLYHPSDSILGFSGRLINEEKEAKYVNTPETTLYHKRETLFGIQKTKEAIKKEGSVILVEGEFDAISCFQNGINNVVAVKGSAVTYEQLMLLKRYTKKIYFCLDADFSGLETTKKAVVDAENLDFEVYVISLKLFKDPDEALKNNPADFKKNIKKPVPIYDFIINFSLQKNQADDAFSKKNIGDEVIPFLINIRNPIVQSHYIKKLAEILQVEVKSIELLMQKIIRKQKIRKTFTPILTKAKESDRFETLQKYLLHLIFQNENPPHFFEKINSVVELNDFSIPSYQKLLKNLLNFKYGENQLFDIKKFVLQLPKELMPVFDQVFLFDVSIFEAELSNKSIDKTVYEFKRLSLKKQVQIKIKQADDSNENNNEVKKIMQKLTEVEKKLLIL